MRETSFIEQNKEKWEELEQVLDGQRKNPEKLRELFVHVTDDLSYSRTFYPNRSVRVYLNGLAQRLFLQIYRRKKGNKSRFISFWTEELPLLVYESRRAFRLSFLVFALATAIGILSCAMDEGFVEVVLGNSYMEMTQENIESGDPMAVYKQRGQLDMFLGITVNNLRVAFLTFVMGIFVGVGSIIILVSNGVMLGAFQWFFVQQGLFQESFLTIWIHGTLEISAIIIAGAAGLTMGRGIAFPGTYTRIQAFQRSARRGVKIMVGTTPLFILAGFFEGYLTRRTETPDGIRLAFILICLIFVLFYFVWYPWYMGRRQRRQAQTRQFVIPPNRGLLLDLGKIRGAGTVFSDVFRLLSPHGNKLLALIFGTAFLYCLLIFLPLWQAPSNIAPINYEPTNLEQVFFLYGGGDFAWLLRGVHMLVLSILATSAFHWVHQRETGYVLSRKEWWRHWRRCLLPILVLTTVIGLFHWSIVLFYFALPMIILWAYTSFRGGNLSKAWGEAARLLGPEYGRALGLQSLLSLLFLLALFIFSSLAFGLLSQSLSWIIRFEPDAMEEFRLLFLIFCMLSLSNLLWLLLFSGFGLLFYSLLEISEAPKLRQEIAEIGAKRMIRGVERE